MISKIKTLSLATLMAGAALIATSAQANLVVNGSFETGDLTGWSSDTTYGLNPFGTTYGSGMDGKWWHWVAGWETNITTTQTISGLTAGKLYSLTFIMASEHTNSDQMRVSIDGGAGTIFTAPPKNVDFWDNWVAQGLTFKATGTTATIQFDSVGLNSGGYDVGLDKVDVSAIPEPASWALMIGGFGLVGTSLRRQRRTHVVTA